MSTPLKLLVVCGPSGSGKSSLIGRFFKEFPDKFGFSVSHTTRQPRPGEVHGTHYFFTTKEEILARIEKGEFLETACFSGNTYGTSFASVKRVSDDGKVCILDIDVEGVKQVKQKSGLDLTLVFIKPPSIEELEKRLRDRGTETEDSLAIRLNTAKKEMEYGQTPGNFDAVIVNDDLDRSYEEFKTTVLKELRNRGVDIWAHANKLNTELLSPTV